MNLVITGHVEAIALEAQEQLQYRFPPFPTVIQHVTNRIVTFSDIHGDLDALIVCLRDCANVIYKPGFNPSAGQRDPDLDLYFDMDINNYRYDRSLGYEWRHDDTSFVVIIGDLIDPVRTRTRMIENIYHKQIELKILHFINAMNESALRRYQERHPRVDEQIELPDHRCGRIYKLLGNHDLLNFGAFNPVYNKFVRNYTFPEDIPDIDKPSDIIYYQTDIEPIYNTKKIYSYTRDNVFNYTHPGFNVYFETTGTGVALLINDNLFVHGGLYGQITLNDVKQFNRELLQSKTQLLFPAQFIKLCENILPILQVRHYSHNNDDTDIVATPEEDPFDTGRVSCATFADQLVQFCGQNKCGDDAINPKRIRMFKGHCSQSLHNTTPSTVLSGFVMNTGTTEVYSNYYEDKTHPNSFYHGPQSEAVDEKDEDNLDMYHPHNRKWGVTLSCDRNTNRAINLDTDRHPNPQIIKIDVGMGRGQDTTFPANVFNLNIREKTLFESRVPQIIIIPEVGDDNPNRLLLVRSTLKNMAIHMPRPTYSSVKLKAIDYITSNQAQVLSEETRTLIQDRIRRSVYGIKRRRKKSHGFFKKSRTKFHKK